MLPDVKCASHLASWLCWVFRLCLKSISPPSWCSQARLEGHGRKWFLPLHCKWINALCRSYRAAPHRPGAWGPLAPSAPRWALSTLWVLIPAPTHPGAFCWGLHGQERSWEPAQCFPTTMSSFTWPVLISRPCPSISVADSSEGFSLNLYFFVCDFYCYSDLQA